jgi:hypothetical protein
MNLKWVVKVWTEFDWLSISPMESFCEQSNESSDPIKDREFLEQLSDYQFLKDSP